MGVQLVSGDKTLDQIEEKQAALRESIEQVKHLVQKSEQLITQHRAETGQGEHADGSAN